MAIVLRLGFLVEDAGSLGAFPEGWNASRSLEVALRQVLRKLVEHLEAVTLCIVVDFKELVLPLGLLVEIDVREMRLVLLDISTGRLLPIINLTQTCLSRNEVN